MGKYIKGVGVLLLVVVIGSLYTSESQAYKTISKDSVSIEGEVYDEDVFVSGWDVDFDATVDGDLFIAGGRIVLSGEGTGDVYIAGGQLDVEDLIIGKSLIIAGGQVEVDDVEIGRSVYGTGGEFDLDSKINEKLVIAGGSVKVAGEIAENLYAAAGDLRLVGNILGDAFVSTDNLQEGKANIVGSLYTDTRDVSSNNHSDDDGWGGISFLARFVAVIFWLIPRTVFGLVFVYFLRNFVKEKTENFELSVTNLTKCFGLGTFFVMAVPVIAGMLMFTFVGWIPSVLLMLFYIAFLLTNYIAVSVYLGSLIYTKLGGNLNTLGLLASFGIGIVIFATLGLIPWVGWFVKFVIGAVAAGYRLQVLNKGLESLR